MPSNNAWDLIETAAFSVYLHYSDFNFLLCLMPIVYEKHGLWRYRNNVTLHNLCSFKFWCYLLKLDWYSSVFIRIVHIIPQRVYCTGYTWKLEIMLATHDDENVLVMTKLAHFIHGIPFEYNKSHVGRQKIPLIQCLWWLQIFNKSFQNLVTLINWW